MHSATHAAHRYPVHRLTLSNGLRVLLSPDHAAEVVAVSVVYDVGSRSEPADCAGFAHLFEHLMFQGSANLERSAHARYVQSCGGAFNGTTHLDYTEYFQVLPSTGLEHALFLEADRMRAPALTEASLANQIDVVAEEITGTVLSRPYGAFPWLPLAALLFDTFANAHNGYGAIDELRGTTVEQARRFFERYYAPANAVLCVTGDFSPARLELLVERHFGDIPSREVPARPVIHEPALARERQGDYIDPLAPMAAFASGWRVPDPADLVAYLPVLVASRLLVDGPLGRLSNRLTRDEELLAGLGCGLGITGEIFGVRDPSALVLSGTLLPGTELDRVLRVVDEEADRLAVDGPDAGELAAAVRVLRAQLIRSLDGLAARAQQMCVFELQHGDALRINDLGPLVNEITADEIRQAASQLRPERRATIELIPGAAV
ncbi:pitrilysin family protein [Kutzneria buriramensis]|uniref:Putative Zn-dependent peptidase n=1 Tax=Kutzneria buriramensis TaxID=1045776 RepID=A0A3E0GTQ6_9PSEU|nr:pitrilysin family protein [Kutzneria buriramensis]REH27006.1 putative Zn-dependent peptidase [Kutzneria buriramensis]